ncbi:NB-ARC domain-containing protein [Streptomyces sp. VNUA24]|uniref:NB-ARC domain-containing protein n=1 Tax=Streptomyces sp. VNUA24 TaxID=3031131 RepID=UPI0023B7FEE5|nr:NB-ARC domain-containing protein [Streptomyces sp. VNUA24]WEH12200.1 NB-ARC domain-containing protein [Streptomyces sp. VNUA24]
MEQVVAAVCERAGARLPFGFPGSRSGSAMVGITTGLHGAGGFGKTTLAHMVCAHRRVRRVFRGRVYVVTIGRNVRGRAAIAAKVAEATRFITGDTLESGEDPGRAGDHLGRLLARRPRTLLVIDDVWEPEQLEPFLRGAQEQCVRLVTTRKPAVLPPDACRVVVDRMSFAQADAVLTRQLEPGLPAPLAAALVKATGRWALLLRLVNQLIVVQAATGVPQAVAAQAILERLRALGPASADPDVPVDLDDPTRRNTAVRASIQAATELLPRAGGRRFCELGIFAEDEAIPLPLVALLWTATGGLTEAEARSLCMQMAELSLLTLDGSVEGGTVALHDVVRDYLRVELAADLAELNGVLADAVAATLDPADHADTHVAWWQVSDGYLRDHLIEHLMDAGRAVEAETVASDPRWVQSRLHQRGPTAPWRDLDGIASPTARALAADIARAAHLLSPADPPHALDAILRSRLTMLSQGNNQPQPTVHHLLTNRWPPPDLPDRSLLRTLTGSTAAVQTLAFSPDGTLLATAGDDQYVRLWNPATGACQRTLTGHNGKIRAVAFSSDGTLLATADDDRHTRVWDSATGACLSTLHGRIPRAVAFSPDGLALADIADDGCIWGRDPATGTALRRLTGPVGGIRAVAFSPDGTLLTTAGDDGWVRVWNAATGMLRHSLTDHVSGSRAVAFSPDGTLLATGGEDRRVRLWDPVTGAALQTLSGHEGYVNTAAFSPDGTLLATAGYDRSVRLWNPATGAALRTLSGHEGYVNTLAFSPDGTLLAIAGHDRAVRLRNPATHTASDEGTGVREVAVAAGSRLVTADDDGRVRIRNATTGTISHVLTDYARGVRTVAFKPDGTSLATVGEDGQMWLWDPNTAIPVASFGTDSIRGIRAAAYSPDGTVLATADDYRTLHLRDPETGAVWRTFTTDYRGSRTLAFSTDGALLAAVGNGGTVSLWNIDTGNVQHTFTHNGTQAIQAVAFRADGEMLATADEHGTVCLWNLTTGVLRGVLTGHEGAVGALAFSGPWLATVGDDATLRIWDPDTGTVLTLMRTDSPLRCCSWSPDGRALFAGGRRGLFGYDYHRSTNNS